MTGKKILVVDDFNTSRKIIVNVLSKEGYSVIEAEDGVEALKVMNEHNIDLLVTDYNMPKMDGGELINAVRDSRNHSHIPIFLLTTETSTKKLNDDLLSKITIFIKKPFDSTQLLKYTKKALR